MRVMRRGDYCAIQADAGTTGLLSRLFLKDARYSACSRSASLALSRTQLIQASQLRSEVSLTSSGSGIQIITHLLHVFPNLTLFVG